VAASAKESRVNQPRGCSLGSEREEIVHWIRVGALALRLYGLLTFASLLLIAGVGGPFGRASTGQKPNRACGRVLLAPGPEATLPLHQLPDLRLQLALLADLGEDLHGPLEVRHGLFLPAGGVQQVGEVVVQRRLPMTIP
jgi:hypothetical protein